MPHRCRYGGGVQNGGGGYRDPAVAMEHVYLAHSRRLPLMGALDVYVACRYIGFVGGIWGSCLKMMRGGGSGSGGASGSGGSCCSAAAQQADE